MLVVVAVACRNGLVLSDLQVPTSKQCLKTAILSITFQLHNQRDLNIANLLTRSKVRVAEGGFTFF